MRIGSKSYKCVCRLSWLCLRGHNSRYVHKMELPNFAHRHPALVYTRAFLHVTTPLFFLLVFAIVQTILSGKMITQADCKNPSRRQLGPGPASKPRKHFLEIFNSLIEDYLCCCTTFLSVLTEHSDADTPQLGERNKVYR